jgi:hypothetical protein
MSPYFPETDVVGHRASMNAPLPSGAPATDLTQNPLLRISAPVDALSQIPNPQASSAVFVPLQSQMRQAAPLPAAAQSKPESTPAVNGMQADGDTDANIEPIPKSEKSYLASKADTELVKDKKLSGTLYFAKLQGKIASIKFDGRTVREQDAGGGKSTCKNTAGLVQGQFFAHPQIPDPGCWHVAGPTCVGGSVGNYTDHSNQYGDDFIELPSNYLPGILHFNPHGCSVTLYQNMQITCKTDPSGYCTYWKNELVLTIHPGPGGATTSITAKSLPREVRRNKTRQIACFKALSNWSMI